VTNANRASVPSPIANPLPSRGDTPRSISAGDPDGDGLTLSATNLPAFATLTNTGNGSGTSPCAELHAGGHVSRHRRGSDNGNPALSASQTITITVNNVNRPVLSPIGDLWSRTTVVIPLTATDPDGNLVLSGPPPFATFAATGNGTGTLTLSPGYGLAGVHGVDRHRHRQRCRSSRRARPSGSSSWISGRRRPPTHRCDRRPTSGAINRRTANTEADLAATTCMAYEPTAPFVRIPRRL
jgi:hypothetical protein